MVRCREGQPGMECIKCDDTQGNSQNAGTATQELYRKSTPDDLWRGVSYRSFNPRLRNDGGPIKLKTGDPHFAPIPRTWEIRNKLYSLWEECYYYLLLWDR
jgi:hypothetical protein